MSKQRRNTRKPTKPDVIEEALTEKPEVIEEPVETAIDEAELKRKEEFLRCLEIVFDNEGGLSDHKADKGGLTKYGISLRFLQRANIDIDGDGEVDENDILWLTKDDAEKLYHIFFYKAIKADQVKNLPLRAHIFDIAVNHGVPTGSRIVQQALKNIGKTIWVDGVVGSKTLSAINYSDVVLLNNAIVEERKRKYHRIVEKDPSQRVNLSGWINRANSFYL